MGSAVLIKEKNVFLVFSSILLVFQKNKQKFKGKEGHNTK